MTNGESKVAVITGASSGIGRATALQFAREGYDVVLAARRAGALDQLASECASLGVRAVAVPTDVTDPAAVAALATRASEELGRVDAWVNNAGVLAVGRFEDTPGGVFERVIQTNLLAAVSCARAALRLFRKQGKGVLINVGSLESKLASPYSSAYAASKQGMLGWSRALRGELQLENNRHIRVCVVMPATFDTPLFQSAANFTGYGVMAMKPIYKPERVARVITRVARRPRDEVYAGTSAHLFGFLTNLAPRAIHRAFARTTDREHLDRSTQVAHTTGNLFASTAEASIDGGWKKGKAPKERRPRAAAPQGNRRLLRRALAVAPLGAVGGFFWARQAAAAR